MILGIISITTFVRSFMLPIKTHSYLLLILQNVFYYVKTCLSRGLKLISLFEVYFFGGYQVLQGNQGLW